MAEGTTAVANKKSSTGLIVGLIMLLLVGGVGIFFFLRSRKDEDEKKDGDNGGGGVDGRTNYTKDMDEKEFIDPTLPNPNLASVFLPLKDEPTTIWVESARAKALIQEMARMMAKSDAAIGRVRAQVATGSIFLSPKYNKDTQDSIKTIFGLFNGVDPEDNLTYPIYSTYEANGKAIYDQLKNLHSKGWEKLGLSNAQESGEPWFIPALDLNLFYGMRGQHTHSADKIWWYQAGAEGRQGLDFFKLMNGHPVEDRRLLETVHKDNRSQPVHWGAPNAVEAFPAGNVYMFVDDWIKEIEALDAALLENARNKLTNTDPKEGAVYGWTFSIVDPSTVVTDPTDPTNT